MPWYSLGSCAAVDIDGSLVFAEQVYHWHLASYTTELFAIINMFSRASGPILIHTGSLTIVNQFESLIAQEAVDMQWTLCELVGWAHLWSLYKIRIGLHPLPLRLQWCPAHLLENVAETDITEELAEQAGSNILDILNNRKVTLPSE